MKNCFWLLILSAVCHIAAADVIPEPGLATPAYIPPPPALVASTPVYSQQITQIHPLQTVYYNQPIVQTQPIQIDRYSRYASEREQMFGNAYIRR
jgi:uncharacterized membrane protein